MPKRISKKSDDVLWLPGYPFSMHMFDANAPVFVVEESDESAPKSSESAKAGLGELRHQVDELSVNREPLPLDEWCVSYKPTQPDLSGKKTDAVSRLLW
jgi:hypothetical protein